MEQLAKELSLYDVLAYFIVGAVAFCSIVLAVEAFLKRYHRRKQPILFRDHSKLAVFAFVVAAYILGNLIQAAVSITDNLINKNKIEQHYSRPEDAQFKTQLLKQVNDTFQTPPADQIFNLCQTYSQVRNIDGYIQIMHGRYAFFRGLAIALIISLICFFLKSRWEHRQIPIWLTVIFLLAIALSIYRAIAYNNYFVDHVYRVFYVSTVPPATDQQQKKALP